MALKIIIYIFFVLNTFAEEVDNFKLPNSPPADATKEINRLINDHFDILVEKYNEDNNKDCRPKVLQEKVTEVFGRNFSVIALKISNIVKKDDYSKQEYKIPSFGSKEKSETVYHGTSVKGCCEKVVSIKGTYIGVDKIDHFFGNGGLLWQEYLAKHSGEKDDTAVALLAERMEHVGWGLAGMGVKSYGDIAAHWSGFKFYKTLLKDYYTCSNGRLKRTAKKFQIENYVDDSWDESINCSTFEKQENLEVFIKNISCLNLTCPRKIDSCKSIIEKYLKEDALAFQIAISPVCKGHIPLSKAIEKGDYSPNWQDLKNYAGGITIGKVSDFIGITNLLNRLTSEVNKHQCNVK